MTTPERLRRRQRFIEAYVVAIGVMLLLSTLYFRSQDAKQRECIADNFSGLANTLSVRGDLSTQEAQAQRQESRATRRLFRDAFSAQDQADFYAAYATYRDRLKRVAELRKDIAEVREENPFPDFPEGTCDSA